MMNVGSFRSFSVCFRYKGLSSKLEDGLNPVSLGPINEYRSFVATNQFSTALVNKKFLKFPRKQMLGSYAHQILKPKRREVLTMMWVTPKEHFAKTMFHSFVMSRQKRFMIKTHAVSQK